MVNYKPRVVIVGGGFGGLAAAKQLRSVPVEVTLLDRHNYHLFQPLLYQVATGVLSPANIASPLRGILRHQRNCRVLMGQVVDFDLAGKRVIMGEGDLINYDWLIVAAGATHGYFGHDEWEKSTRPGLKTIDDATEIRNASCSLSKPPNKKRSGAASSLADVHHRWWRPDGCRDGWRLVGHCALHIAARLPQHSYLGSPHRAGRGQSISLDVFQANCRDNRWKHCRRCTSKSCS